MNRIGRTAALIFVWSLPIAAKAVSPDTAIRAVYRQYDQVVKENSPLALLDFFRGHLAPDYQQVDAQGRVRGRAQILESLERQAQTGRHPQALAVLAQRTVVNRCTIRITRAVVLVTERRTLVVHDDGPPIWSDGTVNTEGQDQERTEITPGREDWYRQGRKWLLKRSHALKTDEDITVLNEPWRMQNKAIRPSRRRP